MSKKLITEGKASIEVDTADIVSKDLEVFYNPDMVLNRDMTLAVLQTHFDSPVCMALPLAGSGVRAVRILKEVPHLVKKLLINDCSPEAVQLIHENLKRNSKSADGEKIIVSEHDACFALENSVGFDYIDIDPFGSPNQFLDTAIRKLSRNGLLAVTATDTAALAGTYPTTCKRKYWAKSCVTPLKHEMGIRILARKVMLLGMHHNKVLVPLLSYHDKHYYRIFFKCVKSKENASQLLDELDKFMNYDKESGNYEIAKQHDEEALWCGPIYTGQLHDKEFLSQLKNNFEHKIVNLALEEIHDVGSYDTHQIAQKNNLDLVPLDALVEKLKEQKFEASRCTTNLHAIKTTASFEIIVESMKELSN